MPPSDDDFRELCVFNLQPCRYVHSSWLQTLAHGELTQRLSQDPRVSSPLNRYLLNRFGLLGDYCFALEGYARSVAVLPTEKLARLVRLAGLVQHSQQLRQVISAQEVAHVRAQMGESDYQFTLNRAPFVISPANLPRLDLPRDDLPRHCDRVGMYYLSASLHQQPVAVMNRVLLKLHYELAADADAVPPSITPALATLLMSKLKKIVCSSP